ncbi:hypothetical protein P4S72_13245 [Vibrio sp. PP-XX7]
MTTFIDNPEGATPLSPDDMIGLKHKHVETRKQLNELEAANILQGQLWASQLKAPALEEIFDRDFVTRLHLALLGMYGNGPVTSGLESLISVLNLAISR